jgi:hypothetical protein
MEDIKATTTGWLDNIDVGHHSKDSAMLLQQRLYGQ